MSATCDLCDKEFGGRIVNLPEDEELVLCPECYSKTRKIKEDDGKEQESYDYTCQCGKEIKVSCEYFAGFKFIQDIKIICDSCKKEKCMTVMEDVECEGATSQYIKGYEMGEVVKR